MLCSEHSIGIGNAQKTHESTTTGHASTTRSDRFAQNSAKTANTCLRNITERNSQIFTDMIKMTSQEWLYFISLVEQNIPAEDALHFTRTRYPRTIEEQMTKDLRNYGIERD